MGLTYVSQPLTPENAATEIERAVNSIFTEQQARHQRIRDLMREWHLRYLPVAIHSGSKVAFRLASEEV